MITKKNIQIQNKSGFMIDVDIFSPAGEIARDQKGYTAKKLPIIIFTHGFKGFKDWGGFPYMMERISASGFISVSYNFSHNGVDYEHPKDFVRLDLFANNTYSLEVEELGMVIEHFYDKADDYNILKDKVALIGHSRGGGISLLKASEDNRIKCLVTLASVFSFDRYTEEHKKAWREQGYFETLNTRTNQLMRLNVSLLDDLEKNHSHLDIIDAVKKLNKPFLIIHGKEDLSVRYEEAVNLYENSNKKYSQLYTVNNTGHTFGVAHPFSGTTSAFEDVIDKTIRFLSEKL